MEEEENGREKTVVMWSGRLTRQQTVFPAKSVAQQVNQTEEENDT